MKMRIVLFALLGLAGLIAAPARAQLVHLSMSFADTPILIVRANDASIPWDHSGAFVTSLDLYYDPNAALGESLDPSRNFWRIRIDAPEIGRTFNITRPIDAVTAWDRGLTFDYLRETGVHEDFELNLVFATTIPTEGPLPVPPLPALGTTEYAASGFTLDTGNSFYHVDHLTEAYGGGSISGVRAEFVPVPESSSYAGGALALMLGVVWLRRGRRSAGV